MHKCMYVVRGFLTRRRQAPSAGTRVGRLPSAFNPATMLVRLVLLQHGNELGRDTATGPLLSDERMRSHASVQAWTWHSCDDNERIGELLASLASPALLWAAEGKAATSAPHAAELVAPTYVFLDGTWQEAEEVFSRGPPCLRAMARVTLPAAPTTFWLRSPFAGKARFGEAGSDGQGLVHSYVENKPPASRLIGRGWPKFGAAWGVIWR
jgi:DTW domain-containing protein YfiP